ncbi:uncharacterized protein LOC131948367 [Physella acuta]|uniref:uncharacterized protein LOC131948367 n=1 Tax=Physella acuta TaxID=109671 RepID=UPI0027DBE601|nr:uncharacterized protein LOC131948367 [Physella acuta]
MGLDILTILLSVLVLLSGSSALDCGDGWTLRAGTTLCYRLETAGKTWDNAKDACIGFGGGLTTVDDTAEKAHVGAMSDIANNYMWIGLTDLEGQGIWNWQASPCMSFVDFRAGEPNYGNGGRECAMLLKKGSNYQWDDVRCSNLFPYVCRKDIGPQSENNTDCDNSCKTTTDCVGYTYKSGECTLHVKKAAGSRNGVTTTIVTCVKLVAPSTAAPTPQTPAPAAPTPAPVNNNPAPAPMTPPPRRHRHWWSDGDGDGDSAAVDGDGDGDGDSAANGDGHSAEDGDGHSSEDGHGHSSEEDDLIYERSRGSHSHSASADYDRRRPLSPAAARRMRLIQRLLEEEYDDFENRDRPNCKSPDKLNYVVINNN